ncbi:MAG TPA: hypothetical protein VIT24_14980, partial [Acidimicrobiales bacterium]
RLRVADVARMVGPDWPPPLTTDAAEVEAARAAMRLEIRDFAALARGRPLIAEDLEAPGCDLIDPGASRRYRVVGPGVVSVRTNQGTTLDLEWMDPFGTGSQRVEVGPAAHIQYVEPDGPTELTVGNDGTEELLLCGVDGPKH